MTKMRKCETSSEQDVKRVRILYRQETAQHYGFVGFKNTFWHSIRRLSFQLSGPVGSLYVAAAIGRSLRDNDARFDLGALGLSTAILRRIWIPATSADERGATNVLP